MKINKRYFLNFSPFILSWALLLVIVHQSLNSHAAQLTHTPHITNPIMQCESTFAPATRIIKLGMSTALSGPIQHSGRATHAGVTRRLNEANCDLFWRNQGIRFELITLDDSYIPEVAAENTYKLINDHKVIALVGNLGTPTAARAWRIANDAGVLFYAASTGAAILRQTPPAPFVFNYRASNEQEINLIISDIIAQGIPVKQIGLFLQNDTFGNGGLTSARAALRAICGDCEDDVLIMRYERSTLKVDEALHNFIGANPKPKAIILVGTTEPSVEFVRFAHRLSPATRFYSLSAGRAKFAQLLPDIHDRIYFTRVTPPTPLNDNSLMDEAVLEGYLSTSLLMDAMRTISKNINSTTLRNSLIDLEQTLEQTAGTSQHTNNQQLMDLVWLTPLHDIKQNSTTGKHSND